MAARANARFTIQSWDERPYDDIDRKPKLTRVGVTREYRGDIEGKGVLEYLMVYRDDGSAVFVGLQRVEGSLAGKSGSFVLRHNGTFENGVARERFDVVPGSGTEELAGLHGSGEFASGHAEEYPLTLEFDFEGATGSGDDVQ
jgi:hypothetical protein